MPALYKIIDNNGTVRFQTDVRPLEESEAKNLTRISYDHWHNFNPDWYPMSLVKVGESE